MVAHPGAGKHARHGRLTSNTKKGQGMIDAMAREISRREK